MLIPLLLLPVKAEGNTLELPASDQHDYILPEEGRKAEGALHKQGTYTTHTVRAIAVIGLSGGPLALDSSGHLGMLCTAQRHLYQYTRGEHRAPHVREIYMVINKVG